MLHDTFLYHASLLFNCHRYRLIADVQLLGIRMHQDEMHNLLSEIDLAYNGQMELQDYLQVNRQPYT